MPKLAGLPTPWVKEVLISYYLFHSQRFFMLDKRKGKNKSYEIVWISWHM